CFNFANNITLSTSSARPTTLAEPALTACPAAKRLAALIVEDTIKIDMDAEATFSDSIAAKAPADTTSPFRVNRFANIDLATASRLATVPSGKFSCRATSLRVLPSRSHKTITARYLAGRRVN